MAMLDEIRNNPADRPLLLAQDVASVLLRLEWTVRQGAAHRFGIADVAASREWERKGGESRLHLVIRCHSGSRVLFSTLARAEESVASLATSVVAPRTTVRAAAFRADEAFADVVDEAFASINGVLDDIAERNRCELEEDLADGRDRDEALAALARRRALVHAIIVTDAPLWTLTENRVARAKAVRLHRTSVVSAESQWIDVVDAAAFADYAAASTRHYARVLGKR